MPRAGFEPATTRSSAERSPRLSYLGGVRYLHDGVWCFKVFWWFGVGAKGWFGVLCSDSGVFIVCKRKYRLIVNLCSWLFGG